jgi:hypothetical protein
VTNIDKWAFSRCTGLETVFYSGTETQKEQISFEHSNEDLQNATWIYISPIPDYFTYTIDGTNLTITGYTGTEADLVIESVYIIDGAVYTMTGIGDWAFHNCTSLTSITIPDSITSIGYNAFNYCDNLTDVYYTGSQEEAAEIEIGQYNDPLLNAAWMYEWKPYTPGDLDGVEGVTDADAVYLLYHTFVPGLYPVDQECDFNGDGEVNDADAVHLLYYTFLPDLYPLH